MIGNIVRGTNACRSVRNTDSLARKLYQRAVFRMDEAFSNFEMPLGASPPGTPAPKD